VCYFFFQAEDGIRDSSVTGVQTCAFRSVPHPALVLNADFQPLSYFPLSVFSWEDAIKAVVSESHVVVAEYDRVVRSPSVTMRLRSEERRVGKGRGCGAGAVQRHTVVDLT